MKIIFKVLASIIALGMVILLGLHLFLQYGLTKAMRETVLPQLKTETGMDVRVGRLSINLPNGILCLKDLEVKNPEGFLLENLASVDRVDIEVDLLSLLKQKLVLVKNVEVENALLNVIRNQEGEINLSRLKEAPSPSVAPVPATGKAPPEKVPDLGKEPVSMPQSVEGKPLPEVLIEAMQCGAKVRYIDLKLNSLDIALDLNVVGSNLSTQKDPSTPWGDLFVIGSLGNSRASFTTDLHLRLAPVVDPQAPSFDLTGSIMEIDPRIMDEAYSKLGIRSAPFGLDPNLHCRDGWFRDSSVVLSLTDIVLEDKLAKRLGGMATIGALRFPVPIEGPLQEPTVDLQQAISAALGGNVQTLLDSFLKGVVSKDRTEGLADGSISDTNAPSSLTSDTLIDILGEQVEEIGENEELKNELKNIGKWLFGK